MKIFRNIFRPIFLGLLITGLLFPQVGVASSIGSKREEAKRVKNQVDALSREAYKATGQYNSAVSQLEKIRINLSKTEKELAAAQEELQKDQKVLDRRVKDIYLCGNVQFLEVILGSKNLHEFLVRAEMLNKIGQHDTKLLNDVKAKKQQVEDNKTYLANQKEKQQSTVAVLKKKQSQIESNLQKQQNLLSGVKSEVAQLENEERDARARVERERQKKRLASRSSGGTSYTKTSIKGFVFPAAGPHSYSNDWGAARVGHRHQGCDIMAPKGSPAVACVSGVVRTSEGRRQGHAIWLRGDDGNSYFYGHLNGYAAGSGQRVSAGQVIGYVGNTGNASGGAAHIQFEVHPGGGGAVNPYPILRASD